MGNPDRRRFGWASLAVLFLCFSLVPSAWSQKAEKLLLRTTWVYNPSQAWAFIGREKGFFKAAGIDLELQDGRGSRKNTRPDLISPTTNGKQPLPRSTRNSP